MENLTYEALGSIQILKISGCLKRDAPEEQAKPQDISADEKEMKS